MITTLTSDNLDIIRNPAFAAYAETYRRIHDDFMAQRAATGIEIAADDQRAETEAALARLRALEATFRNGGRSIVANAISPACVACQTGEGSATFFVSLQCHRDCYYCFNPNQVETLTSTRATSATRPRSWPKGLPPATRPPTWP